MTNAEPWVLGIDFGTCYTVAAARWRHRAPEVIEIGGERRVPSVVLADEDGTVVVGRSAENLATAMPSRAMRAPKSRLGEPAPVVLGGRPHQVIELVAALLAYVYGEAVRQQGSEPAEVRLTHPASWSRPRLDRFRAAAVSAGLPEPVMVPEPVAAAVSYADAGGVVDGGFVAVYDLGGGTFDTAILRAAGEGFVVIGRPAGEDRLGGDLFDELLANHIGTKLDPAAWEALQISDDRAWQQAASALRAEARRVKEALSSHPYAELLLGLPSGMVSQRLTQTELETLIAPYIATSVDLLAQAVGDAGVSADSLDAIYLVGGASRSPVVERLVNEAFPGVRVSRRGDPKTAVALGATHERAAPSTLPGPPPGRGTYPLPAPPGPPPVPGSGGSGGAGGAGHHAGPPPGSYPPASYPPASHPSPGTTPAGHGVPTLGPPVAPSGHAPVNVPPAGPPSYPPGPGGWPGGPSGPGGPAGPPQGSWPPGPPPAKPTRSGLLVGGVVAVLVLVAALVAVVALSSGGSEKADSTTTSRRSTTTQRRSSTTLTPTLPTLVVTTAPTTPTSAPVVGVPTAAEVQGARLAVGEVGAGYVEAPYGADEPFCGIEPVVSSQLRSNVAFENATEAVRVDNDVQSYADAAAAAADIELARQTVDSCFFSSTTIGGADYFVGVVPFSDAPVFCDDTYVVLQVATPSTTGLSISRAVGAIRCGRNVSSVGYGVVGRDFTDADASAFGVLLQTAATKLAAIPK